MEPPNPTALGFDVASEAARLEPVEAAMLTGSTVASPRIRLVEDEPSVYSIAVFDPVYRPGMPTGTPEERRRAFRGVAAEVFRVAPLIERALASVDIEGLSFVLLDTSAPPGTRTLYESEPGLLERPPAPGSLVGSVEFPFADRRWSLSFIAPPGFVGSPLPLSVLTVGLLLSALAALALGALQTIRQLQERVQEALKLGQYTLVEKIGEGGMGSVYKARHAMLRRPTAVKLLPPSKSNRALLERFEREVQLTSQLTHPNTIAIYDYGRTPDGIFYYVMEYVDGISLDRLVETYGPLEASRTVALLRQVCASLAEAHDVGLIHRDIKPANLMLCIRGGVYDFVKVLDFGLVKELGDGASEASRPDVIMGTPLYMAPEAISAPQSIGPRSDLYALGGVAYFLLTGAPVFEDDNVIELVGHHLRSEPLPPSRKTEVPIPDRLEALILACLAKDPAQRPASARALLEALDSSIAPAWTQERARDWWSIHEPARYARARRAEPPASGPEI